MWDMRSLKSIYTIPAHRSAVSDLKFFRPTSPFPYTLSKQRQQQQQQQPAPADGDMDVDVKPDVNGPSSDRGLVDPPLSGSYLVSSGFDGLVKFWSADDWQLVKALSSEAGGRVTSVDLSGGMCSSFFFRQTDADGFPPLSDGKFVVSGESQRTFKLWAAERIAL
jgi:U4/U6 small nuclear ribonucleoprotein PRP4